MRVVLLAAALVAVPIEVLGQQAKTARLGVVWISSKAELAELREALVAGLRDVGYEEGRNIVIDERSGEGKVERFPALLADLLRSNTDVIFAPSTEAARAAKAATSSVPVVMANVTDPDTTGLVASLRKPGGNLTGLANVSSDLSGKQLELVKEALPGLSRVAVVLDRRTASLYRGGAEAAGRSLNLPVEIFEVLTIDEADRALVSAARSGAGAAVFMGPASQAFLIKFRARIAATAVKHRLPTMMPSPIWVEGGGLMSYGVDLRDQYRRAAVYIDKILKGAKPADLPVEQPVKLELLVNLKTAKALGVTIPQSLLLRADRIIE